MTRCVICDSAGLDDPRVYDSAYALLSDARRARADSYTFPKDRALSVAAGLFIRSVEASYGNVTESALGRPQCPGTEFSLSHSGRYVAFAISDGPVGVDIETIGGNQDLAGTVMTRQEHRDFISTVAREDREDVFARMWTAKESYMKALGVGLGLPPGSFRVLYGYVIRSPDPSMEVHELPAPDGYRVSVCSADRICSVRNIGIGELLGADLLEDLLRHVRRPGRSSGNGCFAVNRRIRERSCEEMMRRGP